MCVLPLVLAFVLMLMFIMICLCMCVCVVRNENSVDRGSFHVCVDVSVRVRFGLCYRW